MPDIAGASLPAAQVARNQRPELAGSAADRLIGNIDTSFKHHLLDLAQAQIETDVQPDRVSNDLGPEAVAFVADRGLGHALRLRWCHHTDNRP